MIVMMIHIYDYTIYMCITKGNNAIAGSDIIFPSQADSKHTEGFAGKEEKQEESFFSIFKVNKFPTFILLLILCHPMQMEEVEIMEFGGRRLGEPVAMERQDSQEGLRVTLAEMEKVNSLQGLYV